MIVREDDNDKKREIYEENEKRGLRKRENNGKVDKADRTVKRFDSKTEKKGRVIDS